MAILDQPVGSKCNKAQSNSQLRTRLRRRVRHRKLMVERLEDRTLLTAILTVTNTSDTGPGSLRAALEAANVAAEPVSIVFEIANSDLNFIDVDADLPSGDPVPDVLVIRPASPLPPLANPDYPISVDGRTQTVFGGDTNFFGPEVVLDGSLAGTSSSGLRLESNDNQVWGLNIQQYSYHGLVVSGDRNICAGNFIGTDATGTMARGNGRAGVVVQFGTGNVIGGSDSGAGNLISGNLQQGVFVWHETTRENRIQGNLIGTDATGLVSLGNAWTGVQISQSSDNLIGGIVQGSGNVISSNLHGISIVGVYAIGNEIVGNLVGTDLTGTADLGNTQAGVQLNVAGETVIGGTHTGSGNVISGSGGPGNFIGLD